MSNKKPLPSMEVVGLGESHDPRLASLASTPSLGKEGLVRAALQTATASLSAVTDTPRLDAELLMAHALGVDRTALILNHLDVMTPAGFQLLLERRLAHQPLAYITGVRDFWSISLKVEPGILIPRPDSETLIEAALAHFGDVGPRRVLDLGTGSGALLLSCLAEWPQASGLGIDRSDVALRVAQANAEALGLAHRAVIQLGDWAQGVTERFDLILCNPPYVEAGADLSPEVRNEPHDALFAGADGLDDYRRLIPQLPPLLAAGGMIAVEIGAGQGLAVCELFVKAGLSPRIRHDLAGRDRAVVHFSLGKTAEST